jgi:hypothetical protein
MLCYGLENIITSNNPKLRKIPDDVKIQYGSQAHDNETKYKSNGTTAKAASVWKIQRIIKL